MKNLRALIVDDDVEAASTLKNMLELEGLQVTAVHDGIEALRLLKDLAVDVAVLDLDLPGMDGVQLGAMLHARPDRSRLLLIAASGYGRAQDVALCMETGFDHHLRKPFEFEALIELIEAFRERLSSIESVK